MQGSHSASLSALVATSQFALAAQYGCVLGATNKLGVP